MGIMWLVLAFLVGIVVGIKATWMYMNWLWKRNPYHFKVIIERVIALRESKKSEVV